jgi:hypothetical protein
VWAEITENTVLKTHQIFLPRGVSVRILLKGSKIAG